MNERKIPEKYGVISVVVKDCDSIDSQSEASSDFNNSMTTEKVERKEEKVEDVEREMNRMFRSAPKMTIQKAGVDKNTNVKKGSGDDNVKLGKGEVGGDELEDFSEADFENLFSETKFKPNCDNQPEFIGHRQGKYIFQN